MNFVPTLLIVSTLAVIVSGEQAFARRAREAATPAPQACDISIEQELTTRTQEQQIKRFTGNRDYVGRKWWLDLAIAPLDAAVIPMIVHIRHSYRISECMLSGRNPESPWSYQTTYTDDFFGSDDGRPFHFETQAACQEHRLGLTNRRPFYANQASADWDTEQKIKVKQKCEDEIREEYANTIQFDNGRSLFSREFFCSEPEVVMTNGGRVRRWASWLTSYTPSMREVTDEQIHELRCQKIRACQVRASTSADFQVINQLNLEQGCDL